MIGPFSAFCQDLRHRARGEAERFLAAEGFAHRRGGKWVGAVAGPAGEPLELSVSFPDDFPDRLPEVAVLSADPAPVRAHVGPFGLLCIAPEGSALIDASDGARVVRDAIARARAVLFPEGDTDRRDTEAEFDSYWASLLEGAILSVLPPDTPAGETWVAPVKHPAYTQLVAASREQLLRWATVTGAERGRIRRGYHVRLSRLPTPPGRGEEVTLARLLEVVADGGGPGASRSFQRWLRSGRLPATVTLSAPMALADDEAVFSAVVPAPAGDALRRAERGFRPGRVPVWRLLACASREPLIRPEVHRADRAFVVPRGGGMSSLSGKKVVVVGCGAVGAHLASLLASSGVGKLLLVDHETLTTANLYRHLLGAESLGAEKALAVRDSLHRRFPDLPVGALALPVQRVLDEHPGELDDADLVAVALGDETLEGRLNGYFGAKVRRVHVWLEPLGLGGHVLATGGRKGCLDCLYRRDEVAGLLSMASLVAPGQTFRRAIGGCAGTFTPYGITDAVRAATEAAREAVRLLTGGGLPRLTSWVTDRATFERAGFRVSARCERLRVGAVEVAEDFARPDCPVCGGQG